MGSSATREAALDALYQISGVGNENAIAAVSALLTHDEGAVRSIATESLGRLAEKGDQNAIHSVSCWLSHESPHVREAAIQALAIVGKPDIASLVTDLQLSDLRKR